MLLEFARQFRGSSIARCQDNKSLDNLTAHFIGAGNHRGLGNGGMFFQCAFDLERADAITRADNHIVSAPHEPKIPIFIFIGTVASYIPVTANSVIGGFSIMTGFAEYQ